MRYFFSSTAFIHISIHISKISFDTETNQVSYKTKIIRSSYFKIFWCDNTEALFIWMVKLRNNRVRLNTVNNVG